MTKILKGARWLLMIAGITITLWLSVLIVRDISDWWNVLPALVALIPAVVVLLRRDWHVVGWLVLAMAVLQAVEFAEVIPLLPAVWQAWMFTVVNVAFWSTMACLVAFFPDGLRAQTGAPGRFDRFVVGAVALATLLSGFTTEVQAAGWSGPTNPPTYANPLGFGWFPVSFGDFFDLIALLGFVAATVNLIVRSRRATGDVRQQYLWVLFPFAILAAGVPIAAVITTIRNDVPGPEWAIAIIGYSLIPLAFGVAMTRYRLYDIDRIISRTVTYTVVVGFLGAMFFGLVTLTADLLPSQNALAVAGSTLAVAAAFNPLRKRIQRRVDRRFNRSAYRAEIVTEQVAARLRDPLTIEELTDHWVRTVIDNLNPASTGVWLSESLAGPPRSG